MWKQQSFSKTFFSQLLKEIIRLASHSRYHLPSSTVKWDRDEFKLSPSKIQVQSQVSSRIEKLQIESAVISSGRALFILGNSETEP